MVFVLVVLCVHTVIRRAQLMRDTLDRPRDLRCMMLAGQMLQIALQWIEVQGSAEYAQAAAPPKPSSVVVCIAGHVLQLCRDVLLAAC